MYTMTITRCNSFAHARLLRAMLETDGFPAVAATIEMSKSSDGPQHALLAFAPHRYVAMLEPLAGFGASEGEEVLQRILKTEAERADQDDHPAALPEEQRSMIRTLLMATLFGAADRVLESQPAAPSTPNLGVTCHDPGDEDTSTKHDAYPASHDAFDNWHSAT